MDKVDYLTRGCSCPIGDRATFRVFEPCEFFAEGTEPMLRALGIALITVTVLVAPVIMGPARLSSALAACEPGERIDASTAEQAKKRIESAGFGQVRDLRKGCDNVWHGTAMKGGAAVRVAVQPQGQVMQEGD
jgi:hypothetical protein